MTKPTIAGHVLDTSFPEFLPLTPSAIYHWYTWSLFSFPLRSISELCLATLIITHSPYQVRQAPLWAGFLVYGQRVCQGYGDNSVKGWQTVGVSTPMCRYAGTKVQFIDTTTPIVVSGKCNRQPHCLVLKDSTPVEGSAKKTYLAKNKKKKGLLFVLEFAVSGKCNRR